MTTPFWYNEPTIIFNRESILQIYPTQQMTFEAKLNAITRLVILMTILGFILTSNWNLIIIAIVTLLMIFVIYKMRKQYMLKDYENKIKKEGFSLNSSLSISLASFNSSLKSYSKYESKRNVFLFGKAMVSSDFGKLIKRYA